MGRPFDAPMTREARVVQRTFERIVGGVVLLFALPLLAFATWAFIGVAWTTLRHGALPADLSSMHAGVMGCFLAIAVFLAQVGIRLFWHRPNPYGSLLSPAGWATLGFVFAGVAVALSIMVVRSGGPWPVGLDLGLASFAAPCFLQALRLRRRADLPR